MKKVIMGENLDEIVINAVNLLCDTVSTTLGPKGNNAIISASSLPAFVTNDGVTIARNIESDDIEINTILEILKEASIKTDEIVGDGTTTTLVLLKELMNCTSLLVKKGISKYDIKRKLNAEEIIIKELIKKYSHIPTDEELKSIAITSAKDENTGLIIYDVFKKIRNIVGIDITTSNKESTVVTFYKGYTIDTLIASQYFFKDTNEIKLINPYIILSEESIYDLETLSEVINDSIVNKKELLIMAPDFDEDVVNKVLSLNFDNEVKIYLLKNPEFGKRQYTLLNDLQSICNCKTYKNFFNHKNVGGVKEVVIDKDKTHFYFEHNINDYISKVEIEKAKLKDDFEIEYYEKRISMLKNGLATIEVGAKTVSEAREIKMHYDDSLHAISSAINGVSVGGGITYLKVSSFLNNDFILKEILKSPFRQILKNANLNYEDIEKEITNKYERIYNVKTDSYENVENTSVLDSTEVLIKSLENAISITNLLLNTNSLVINEQIKNIDIDRDINI